MTAVGGSIDSVSYAGREFEVAADAEAQRTLGGFELEVEANGGSGARIIMTRVPLSYEGIPLVIDDSRGDHEFLQDRMNEGKFHPFVVTQAGGNAYQGEAAITGNFQSSTQNATAPATFKGPGRLTKV